MSIIHRKKCIESFIFGRLMEILLIFISRLISLSGLANDLRFIISSAPLSSSETYVRPGEIFWLVYV